MGQYATWDKYGAKSANMEGTKDLKANRRDFILEDSIFFYSIRIINIKIIIRIIQIQDFILIIFVYL